MRTKNLYLMLGLGIAIFILVNSVFIVHQIEQAIVLQFGRPIKVINHPGLAFKIPFIQNVVSFDKRILDLKAEDKEVIAADQKRVIINAFTKYRIVDPLMFYKSVYNRMGLDSKMHTIFDSSLRQVVGTIPMNDLLNAKRVTVMNEIQALMSKQAAIFGVEIVDVRIMRSDLPQENSNAIFRRMQTDREKEAREIRAEGGEKARSIMATAAKERQIILAEANKKAEILRGEGEGKAMQLYVKTFGKDRRFYDFYRSMQAYQNAFGKEQQTQIIVTPDSEFIRFFQTKPTL